MTTHPLHPPLTRQDSKWLPTETRSSRVLDPTEVVARGIVAGLFFGLAYRVGLEVVETGRLSGLLLLTSELLVVVLTIVRRRATVVDRRFWPRVAAGVSIAGPFCVRPDVTAGLPEPAVLACSGAGLLVVIASKVSLGRSLGLLPANRGIVTTGVYRWVRHPMYLGYLVTHLGFLLGHASAWNAVVLVVADVVLVVRARIEERALGPDPAYRRYTAAVPWRLVPGVY